MRKTSLFIVLLIALCGCFHGRNQLRPIIHSGNTLRVTQSQFHELDQIDEIFTSEESLKIDITFEKFAYNMKQTVLWYKNNRYGPWTRGPASEPYKRWITLKRPEGRYWCRGSVVYSDGSEEFVPNQDTRPSFCLVFDRSAPQVNLTYPGTILNNTSADVKFTVYDEGLGPSPTADIYYSGDNGQTWKRLAVMPITLGENTYPWGVEAEVGTENLLKISLNDYTGNRQECILDRPFDIRPHPTAKESLMNFLTGDSRRKKTDPPAPPAGDTDVTPPPGQGDANTTQGDTDNQPPETTGLTKTGQDNIVPPGPPSSTQDAQDNTPPTPTTPSTPSTPSTPPDKPAVSQNTEPDNGHGITLRVPRQVRPGSTMAISVEGAFSSSADMRFYWRPTISHSWVLLNGTLKDGCFLWRCPLQEADTSNGTFRLKLTDASSDSLSILSNPVIIDSTPPTVNITVSHAEDPAFASVKVTAVDAGCGVDWIRLYTTDNNGGAWQNLPEKKLPSYTFLVPRKDIEQGLFAQATDKLGNQSPAAIAGTPPTAAISSKPDISLQLSQLATQVLRGGVNMHLNWTLQGMLPESATAFIAIKQEEDKPWTRYATLYSDQMRKGNGLWDVPAENLKNLWIRLELAMAGKTFVVSNTIGPYSVDAEPPSIVPSQTEFWASTFVTIPFTEQTQGLSPLALVEVFAKSSEGVQWLPLSTTHSRQKARATCYSLKEGDYALYLRAWDECGNETPKPVLMTRPHATLHVDKTAPDVDFTLMSPYYEGVPCTITVTLSEPAGITLFLQNPGREDEGAISLLRQPLSAGEHKLSFYSPTGLRQGRLTIQADDQANNRSNSPAKMFTVEPSIAFDASSDEAPLRLKINDTHQLRYTPVAELVATKPQLEFYCENAMDGTRTLIDQGMIPSLDSPVYPEWTVKGPEGASYFFVVEAKVQGILRASARTQKPALVEAAEPVHVAVDKPPVPPANPPAGGLYQQNIQSGNTFLAKARKAILEGKTQEAQTFSQKAKQEFTYVKGMKSDNIPSLWGLAQLSTAPFANEDQSSLSFAEEYYKRITELDPTHFQALVHLGNCRIKLKKYREAEKPLVAALAIHDHPKVHYNLGMALLRTHKYVEAVTYLTNKDGTPCMPEAYPLLIECQLRLKDYAKAGLLLEEAWQKGAIKKELYDTIGAFIEKSKQS